jgi:hypothetical protein
MIKIKYMFMYKMNMFSGSVSFLESQFQKRLVQVCFFAAILFWLLGSYNLIDQVQKLLSKVGLRFGKDSTRVVHALIFTVLLYVLSRFIMDPVIRRLSNGSVVEGIGGFAHHKDPATHHRMSEAEADKDPATHHRMSEAEAEKAEADRQVICAINRDDYQEYTNNDCKGWNDGWQTYLNNDCSL